MKNLLVKNDCNVCGNAHKSGDVITVCDDLANMLMLRKPLQFELSVIPIDLNEELCSKMESSIKPLPKVINEKIINKTTKKITKKRTPVSKPEPKGLLSKLKDKLKRK